MKKPDIYFIGILAISIVVLVPVSFTNQGYFWDEGAYISSALALSGKENYNIFTDRYPLISYVTAFGFVLGADLVTINIIPALIAIGSVCMIYLLGSLLFDRKTGFLAALFTTFSWYFWGVAANILSDTISLLFFITCIYFFMRFFKTKSKINAVISGISLGIAFMARSQTMLAIPIIFLFITFIWILEKRDYKKNLVGLIILTFMSLVVIYLETVFTWFDFEHIPAAITLSSSPVDFDIISNITKWIPKTVYYFSFVPVILVLYYIILTVKKTDENFLLLLIGLFATTLPFVLFTNWTESRFLLLAVPFIFIMAAKSIFIIKEKYSWKIFYLVLAIALLSLVIKPSSTGIETGWDNLQRINKPNTEFIELCNIVKQNSNENETIGVTSMAHPAINIHCERKIEYADLKNPERLKNLSIIIDITENRVENITDYDLIGISGSYEIYKRN